MAKVYSQWNVTISFIDQGQQQISKTYQVRADNAALIADVETTVSNLVSDLEAVTTAEVTGFTISKVFVEDSITVPTAAQNENTAQITVDIDGNPLKKALITIPAPAPAIFVAATGPNNNIVDATNTDVSNLVDNFRAGGTVFISDGEDANVIVGGVRVHRRSGRSRTRRIG